MDHRLIKIKRLVAAGHCDFTLKADIECAAEGLTRADVIESILNAQFLRIKNSRSPWRRGERERLYIIDSFNFDGRRAHILKRRNSDAAKVMQKSSTSSRRASGRQARTDRGRAPSGRIDGGSARVARRERRTAASTRTGRRYQRCPLCGSPRIALGREMLQVETKAGRGRLPEVEIAVRRWACPDCGERFLTPEARRELDAALGLRDALD